MTEPSRVLQYRRRSEPCKGREFYVGISADFRSTAPRTQREAGLEFKQWEDRLPRRRPLWEDLIVVTGVVTFLAIVVLMCLAV